MSIQVGGMTCGGCVKSVEKAVGRVAGVKSVKVELESGKVTVEGEAAREAVVQAIVAAGFTAS